MSGSGKNGDRRLRVIFVAAGHFRGNASILRAVRLTTELMRLKQEPTLLLLREPATEELVEEAGVRTRCVWMGDKRAVGYMRAAAELPPQDIIHLINVNFVGLNVARQERGRNSLVVSDWDEWFSRVSAPWIRRWKRRLMEWEARRISDAFVFASRYLLQEYGRRLRRVPTAYIPYALELGGADVGAGAREFTGVPEGLHYMAYVGSLSRSYRNDLKELVGVARVCAAQGLGLVVAGDGSERGWLEEELRAVLGRERLRMAGQLSVSVLDGLLRQERVVATFLPLPDTVQNRSRCPNKLFHYIKAGKPVVTNRVGEAAEVLAERGFYYRYGDADSLAVAMGIACKTKISYDVNGLTWAARCRAYVEFVEKLLAERGSNGALRSEAGSRRIDEEVAGLNS